MATAVWTEGSVVESASMASPPQPRHSAPPNMQQHVSQDAALEEVVWDDSMMDMDDYEETQLQQRADPGPGSVPQEEIKPTEIDPSQVRTEAIHLRGVEHLSTDDVQLYVSTLYPSFESKIEWIDDTSLNVVYQSADIATTALQTLSLNPVQDLEATSLRPAKPLFGEKSIEGLKVRIAFMGDKKERGARDRSRWYLFNPHPAETYERRRNDSRRGERRFDPYQRRRRSRSKSPPLNYDDPPRNEGVELFPSKVSNGSRRDASRDGSRSRSTEQRRRIKASHPAFTNIVQTVSSSDRPRRTRPIDEPLDLFPSKIAVVGRAAMDSAATSEPRAFLSSTTPSLEGRISPGQEMVVENESKAIELFPNKIGKSLEERVESRSLAERIQEDNEPGARELFPELLRRGGGGPRRRRAEDHF